jgi:hypothetical protein
MGLFDFGDSGDPVSGLYGDILNRIVSEWAASFRNLVEE